MSLYVGEITKAERFEFLKSQVKWGEKIMTAPNVKWLTGMSHDVVAPKLDKWTEELEDLRLSGGFYANGQFAGFAEGELLDYAVQD
jgi:hypothetical protein